MGKYIGALQGLGTETEDIEDDEDGRRGAGRTGGIYKQ